MMAIAGKNVETQPTDVKSTVREVIRNLGPWQEEAAVSTPYWRHNHKATISTREALKALLCWNGQVEDNSACSNTSYCVAVGCEGKRDNRGPCWGMGCPGGLPDAVHW